MDFLIKAKWPQESVYNRRIHCPSYIMGLHFELCTKLNVCNFSPFLNNICRNNPSIYTICTCFERRIDRLRGHPNNVWLQAAFLDGNAHCASTQEKQQAQAGREWQRQQQQQGGHLATEQQSQVNSESSVDQWQWQSQSQHCQPSSTSRGFAHPMSCEYSTEHLLRNPYFSKCWETDVHMYVRNWIVIITN